MTVDQTVESAHIANSLLAEVARYTTVDIDNNVASIAVQHNLAQIRMLELATNKGKTESDAQEQVLREFQSLFSDMTSNQIIVSSTYSDLLASAPDQARRLLQTCASQAKQLQAGTWSGRRLEQPIMDRLSVGEAGLSGNETPDQRFQQLASDILTVHFGLAMLPNLLSTGNLHAQTLTSQAYNLKATVKHARRFVALYELISKGIVNTSRVCIKVPSTIPGLQAMRFLSSGGQLNESNIGDTMSEGSIKVLATTIFAVEQGLAAAQAANAIYTAPYINALAAHFFSVENPNEQDKQTAISAGQRSIEEVIYPLQRCLRRLRQDKAAIPTQVMAASFLSIHEAVKLCGLDHVTLGAPIIQGLASTELTAEYAHSTKEARSKMHVASDAELDRFGATLAEKEAEELGCGGWLKQGSRSHARLENALVEDDRCRYMLADALARFTSAERDLRGLF